MILHFHPFCKATEVNGAFTFIILYASAMTLSLPIIRVEKGPESRVGPRIIARGYTYGDRVTVDVAGNVAATGRTQRDATPLATDATAVLEARLEAAERLLAEREQTIEDLRRRLDSEAEERRKLTARVTDQRETAGAAAPVAQPPTLFWQCSSSLPIRGSYRE